METGKLIWGHNALMHKNKSSNQFLWHIVIEGRIMVSLFQLYF